MMADSGDCFKILVQWGSYKLTHILLPNDDWTGVTNKAERKKRQNRLNQRVYRSKRIARRTHRDIVNISEANVTGSSGQNIAPNPQHHLPHSSYTELTQPDGSVLLTCPRRISLVRELVRRAYEDYSLRAPRPESLPTLIRLNVLRAIASNAVLMGFPTEALCRDEFVSPYAEAGPTLPNLTMPRLSCPKMLLPTNLQRTVPHHPWIDLFPIPKFRDNVLLAVEAGLFDEDDLCSDILNPEAGRNGEQPALVVWASSWDVCGWEVNIPFLNKWGWLLAGCPDIIEATNQWREKRGERKLMELPVRMEKWNCPGRSFDPVESLVHIASS